MSGQVRQTLMRQSRQIQKQIQAFLTMQENPRGNIHQALVMMGERYPICGQESNPYEFFRK